MKKVLITTGLILSIGLIGQTDKAPNYFGTMTSYAAEVQAKQLSPRWYADSNGVWYLRNESGTGNVVNAWFEDGGDWYLLAQGDGHMFSGLVHDTITNKWYMMNIDHDGTYGRMLTVDGNYTVNGQNVYLTFNQSHDGSYGAITSGLEGLRGAGVQTEEVAGIATENKEKAENNGNVSSQPDGTSDGWKEVEDQWKDWKGWDQGPTIDENYKGYDFY